jgi:hypothetical protein
MLIIFKECENKYCGDNHNMIYLFKKFNINKRKEVFIMRKKIIATLMALTMTMSMGITSLAAPAKTVDGGVFDAEYYAENNPDVVAAFGTDANLLYTHYVNYGVNEGRLPFAPDTDWQSILNSDSVATIGTITATTSTDPKEAICAAIRAWAPTAWLGVGDHPYCSLTTVADIRSMAEHKEWLSNVTADVVDYIAINECWVKDDGTATVDLTISLKTTGGFSSRGVNCDCKCDNAAQLAKALVALGYGTSERNTGSVYVSYAKGMPDAIIVK